jgi:predicted nucleotidyltransferase
VIHSPGTQVVAKKDVMAANDRIAHPAGAVGVFVRSPVDRTHAYRVKFSDGFEAPIHHDQLTRLSDFKSGQTRPNDSPPLSDGLYERVIYRCVIGSRAYGLDDESSDTDRRGIYLPPAELHWSLFGVPEQLENEATQEVYWELQRFIVLVLKANPNVLECLYSPIVASVTPLGEELLVRAAPHPLVFATISGAHLYGFPSPDSDFDLRGVHLLPLETVVGLDDGEQTIEKEGIYDGLEIDLVTHDAGKFSLPWAGHESMTEWLTDWF